MHVLIDTNDWLSRRKQDNGKVSDWTNNTLDEGAVQFQTNTMYNWITGDWVRLKSGACNYYKINKNIICKQSSFVIVFFFIVL